MKIGTIDVSKLRGLGDKFVGLQKEVLGTLVGNERLAKEGEAQQERATEELRALRAEARAGAHEAKAEAAEQRQKAARKAKASA